MTVQPAIHSGPLRDPDAVREAYERQGAVMFHGLDLSSPADLRALAEELTGDVSHYTGQTDRAAVHEEVYEATPVPGLFPMPLHSEMAYAPVQPRSLFFHGVEHRALGGHTLLGDNRAIWTALPERLRERLASEGVRYDRWLAPPDSRLYRVLQGLRTGALRSWTDALGVQTREEAEARLVGTPHRWEGDWLDVSVTLPAFRTLDGEAVWFNQLHAAHVNRHVHGLLAVALARSVTRLTGRRLLDARFGSGEPVSAVDLDTVLATLRAAQTRLTIRTGDVLWFDNLRLCHGRTRFLGRRVFHVVFTGLP